MRVEVYERIEAEGRLECRTYEVPNGLEKVIVDQQRQHPLLGGKGEVYGFDMSGKQVEGVLTSTVPNVILLG